MSKTMFVAIISICLLLFTSCNNTEEKAKLPDLSGEISLYGELSIGNTTAVAEIKKNNSGDWTAYFSSPKAVDGLKITSFSDGKTEVSLFGMAFQYPDEDVPFETAVGYIEKAIDNAALPENVSVKTGQNGLTLSGATKSGGYIITADDSGSVTEIRSADVTFSAKKIVSDKTKQGL